ncbi:GyrI-like domain-containing protein [Paenibacillus sp. UNC451MF]|uniref:GyrI-like domain-containing protein n=1 Tax=Paenibacillus sp. UNC451MF TaxID=1449063 RepID=UPI00048A537C|nr:effector binding domain-containing protein [Paenibacillus sp. UNC451MF]
MSNTQIDVVQLGERKYIGIAVTSPLKNVKGIGEAQQLFMERKEEIQSIMDESTYVCVHFANEVLFTYIYCMEVTELQSIPESMIGFKVPSNQYVRVQSNGEEPYGLIDKFLRDKGMQRNSNSVSLEVFQFGKEESKYTAEILVPVVVKLNPKNDCY